MKASILNKLQALCERYEELSALMADPDIIANNTQFLAYTKEYSQLTPVVTCFLQYNTEQENLVSAKEFLNDPDPEMQAIAKEDIQKAEEQIAKLELELQTLMIPKDPSDEKNIFLEIRAGAGGDEASIFAGNLFRMYSRFAERQRWGVEVLSANEGEHGGYKEIIVKITGQGVYSRLKFESGAHRVQRVPETESQGRVHTSTCTVAVLPEADEIDDVELNPSELKVDTYRASGAGGQHVNKTDSAIRITHLPTGIVVECQDERSQHKNRARAMSILAAKLYDAKRIQQEKEFAQTRRNLVGTGDRSERIRTYNYPQGRLTDHRINLTIYKLNEVLEGNLEDVIEPLNQEYQMDQLAALADES